ncbi:MAG: hypothetical protein SWO11_03625 [Thermodesulfobacteriota bacterium]|nr:hypothetical protein [Thermodesulfobacteriota bacterium]
MDDVIQDEKAISEQDVYSIFAALIEKYDYIGSLNPERQSWGASGKAKVVVAMETHGYRPGLANIRQIETFSGDFI